MYYSYYGFCIVTHVRRDVLDLELLLARGQGRTLLKVGLAEQSVDHPETQDVGGLRVPLDDDRAVLLVGVSDDHFFRRGRGRGETRELLAAVGAVAAAASAPAAAAAAVRREEGHVRPSPVNKNTSLTHLHFDVRQLCTSTLEQTRVDVAVAEEVDGGAGEDRRPRWTCSRS